VTKHIHQYAHGVLHIHNSAGAREEIVNLHPDHLEALLDDRGDAEDVMQHYVEHNGSSAAGDEEPGVDDGTGEESEGEQRHEEA
jgi:hypothetical protein